MSVTLSASATHYVLTPKAVEDLDAIWRYSAENWSLDQADQYIDDLTQTFALLVSMPIMARERPEFSPPVRIHPHAEQLIIYTMQETRVLIIRVLGGGQNWRAILESADT